MIVVNTGQNQYSYQSKGDMITFAPKVASFCPDSDAKKVLKNPIMEKYDPSKHLSLQRRIHLTLPYDPALCLASAHAVKKLLAVYPSCFFDVTCPEWLEPLLPARCKRVVFRDPEADYYRTYSTSGGNSSYYFSKVSQAVNPWPYAVMCTLGVAEDSDIPNKESRWETWLPVPEKIDSAVILADKPFAKDNSEWLESEGLRVRQGNHEGFPYIAAKGDVHEILNVLVKDILAFDAVITTSESAISYAAAAIGRHTAVCTDRTAVLSKEQQTASFASAFPFSFGSENQDFQKVLSELKKSVSAPARKDAGKAKDKPKADPKPQSDPPPDTGSENHDTPGEGQNPDTEGK